MERARLEQIYEQNFERYLEEYKSFLGFESVSTDPAYDGACEECAGWLVEHLRGIGMESRLLQTPGKPVVYAEYKGAQGQPMILYYGHYDVQPIDPIEAWDTPPFEPTLRDGRMYARGAQDNKGQSFYFMKAVETLIAEGALGCSLRIFLEGEEECGSEGIFAAMGDWQELQGEVLMVCDTGTLAAGVPAITMGLRGVVYLTARLDGIRQDLHSGSHGGVAPNPALEMARLLSTLHDPEGRILVEDFYEGVPEAIDEADSALAHRSPFSEGDYEALIGVPPVGGERDRSMVERRGFRPTVEINGIHSGYGGPGCKTIIPSEAIAKISARLAAQQDPQASLDRIIAHLEKHAPAGLTLTIEEAMTGGAAVMLRSQSPLIQKAHGVLSQLSDHEVLYLWEGASIPVISSLAEQSGAEPLLVGFGLEEDCVHAPNESFDLGQLKQGFCYAAMMLCALGN